MHEPRESESKVEIENISIKLDIELYALLLYSINTLESIPVLGSMVNICNDMLI